MVKRSVEYNFSSRTQCLSIVTCAFHSRYRDQSIICHLTHSQILRICRVSTDKILTIFKYSKIAFAFRSNRNEIKANKLYSFEDVTPDSNDYFCEAQEFIRMKNQLRSTSSILFLNKHADSK